MALFLAIVLWDVKISTCVGRAGLVMVSRSRGLSIGLAVFIALLLMPVSVLELAADGGTHREVIAPFVATNITLS